MARLDLGARNLALRIDGDQEHDLAGDVHTAGEFWIGRGDAGDDGAVCGCGEDSAYAEGQASGEEERTRRTEWDCQGNLLLQRLYRQEGSGL
jgi:hypothetical protein